MNIESLENKKVKEWTKLNQKKYRDDLGLFLVEGSNLIKEAYNAGYLQELILEKGVPFMDKKECLEKIKNLETKINDIGRSL